MQILSNVPALQALSNLSNTTDKIGSSLSKLSSGLRIVMASDDASGLAVSEKLRSQINALGQAKLNAQDGISMLQTADGALNTAHDILQRLNTLAIRSANTATLTASDASLIQNESDALTDELTRMSSTIQFNTKNLLDGSFTAQDLQVGSGATANDQIAVSITGVDAATLGIDALVMTTGAGAKAAITAIAAAVDTVSTNRGAIGAAMNRLQTTTQNLDVLSVNMTASESRIRDVDMAAEMSNYTKLQVLQQAGTAMLAQANSQPQSILKLLQ
jgi:flagellin